MACQINLSWLVIVLLPICLNTSVIANSRASFGDPCNKDTRCDAKAALTCLLGKCQCFRPDAMLFDYEKSKCAFLSGERCSYTAIEMTQHSGTDIKKWQEQVDCVSNAQCSTDGFCSCTSNFMEAVSGACIPKHLFREPCSSDSQCRSDKRLICVEGVCSCNRSISTYHLGSEKCVTLAGQTPPESDFSCVSHAQYNHRQCTCQSGYSEYSGLCLVPYGSSCNGRDSLCHRDMICKNGQCVCKFGKAGQTFSGEKCVSKVNTPCNITVGETYFLELEGVPINISFPCTKNSECRQNDNLYDCQCNKGFIEVNGECQIDYGHPCGGSIIEKCDEIRPLECINGICQCNIDMLHYYDNSSDTCKGQVGSKCNVTATTTNTIINNEFCTSGATCVSTRNITSNEGYCRCSANYETTPERFCEEIVKEYELASSISLNIHQQECLKECMNLMPC